MATPPAPVGLTLAVHADLLAPTFEGMSKYPGRHDVLGLDASCPILRFSRPEAARLPINTFVPIVGALAIEGRLVISVEAVHRLLGIGEGAKFSFNRYRSSQEDQAKEEALLQGELPKTEVMALL